MVSHEKPLLARSRMERGRSKKVNRKLEMFTESNSRIRGVSCGRWKIVVKLHVDASVQTKKKGPFWLHACHLQRHKIGNACQSNDDLLRDATRYVELA